MDGRTHFTLAEEFAAAQDWWREAGVDLVFEDATAHWLKERDEHLATEAPAPVVTPRKAPPPPPKPKIGGAPENWPQTLEAFAPWWLAEPSLDAVSARPRIAPRGNKGAKLMVLVPEPEAGDTEMLFSGPAGKLLESFLSAAGIGEDETYIAAALPRHTPHPDWAALVEAGLGAVTLHHIGLVAPGRVLAFGKDILPLLGHDPAQTTGFLPEINHQAGSTQLFAEWSLDFLLARPAARSGFWQRWLDWTGS